MSINRQRVEELLYEALETEIGGLDVYDAALASAANDELRAEWTRYREQTSRHVALLREVMTTLGMDPDREVPAREVIRTIGEALVEAIELAREEGSGPEAAEIVAAECVVHAETKDHMNWELIGRVASKLDGAEAAALQAAYDEIEDQEDEHLYHTRGWARELWIGSLGLPAMLPPPEELQKVATAAGAARAEAGRDGMLPT